MTAEAESAAHRVARLLDVLAQDTRHASRQLRRSPGTALATIVILGLGMAIGTTLLSVTGALVVRPLPITMPDRLAAVSLTDAQVGGLRLTSYDTFRRFTDVQRVMDGVFGFRGSGLLPVQADDRLSEGVIAAVTPTTFTTLGLTPALGRFFTDIDAPPTGEPGRVIVISHRLWREMFDLAPDAIGRTLEVRGRPLLVIGVMPESFPGLEPHTGNDLYVPLTLLPHLLEPAPSGPPNPRLSHIVGHLKSGVTLDAARAAVSTVWPSIQQPTGTDPGHERIELSMAGGGFSALRDRVETPLRLLTTLALVLVLVGTANLYGLTAARTAAHEADLGVHLALGAPVRRLIRVQALESLAVAAVVILLVIAISPLLSTLAGALLWSGTVPLLTDVTPPAPLLAAIGLVVVVICLTIGVLPGVGPIRLGRSLLRAGHRTVTSSSRSVGRLIAVQVALSVTLVATAGHFVASLHQLRSIDTGFRQTGLVFGRATQLPGPDRIYDEHTHYPELVRRLEALPGVDSAALAHYFPAYLGFTGLGLDAVGLATTADRPGDVDSLLEFVSPRFFETVGSAILRGRDFTWRDREGTAQVVVINEALEQRLFPDGGAIGAHIRVGHAESRRHLEVIGVAADVTVGNLRSPHLPAAFRPRMQEPDRQRMPILLMRTTLDAPALFTPVDTLLREMGHETVRGLATIDDQLDATLRQERLLAGMGTAFASVAALMTLTGLYALLSHSVTRRTREIGVRLALGAPRHRIIRTVLGRSFGLTTVGLVAGVPLAFVTGRMSASLLFGVAPGDPWLLTATAATFIAVAAVAAVIPAWRAARVDPATALRSE